MTMLRTITITLLMSSLLATGHPQKITLPEIPNSLSNQIGHTHVFADKNQTIQLLLPGEKNINAQLYRVAGNTVTPVANPISITPEQHKPTTINIDFPPSKNPTQYILIFGTPEKQQLHITALASNHLDTLRQITQKTPIALINPPRGLTETFRQLSISSRIQNSSQTQMGGMLISFDKAQNTPINAHSKRHIIVNPTNQPNQEIWVSQKPDTWKITVPHHYLNPQFLLTANGQAKLTHILLNTPQNQ